MPGERLSMRKISELLRLRWERLKPTLRQEPHLRRHGGALPHRDHSRTPYKPRDKAKVEVGVQVVQRWILARLRNRRFFSLVELNRAIRELVDQLNDRGFRFPAGACSGRRVRNLATAVATSP